MTISARIRSVEKLFIAERKEGAACDVLEPSGETYCQVAYIITRFNKGPDVVGEGIVPTQKNS